MRFDLRTFARLFQDLEVAGAMGNFLYSSARDVDALLKNKRLTMEGQNIHLIYTYTTFFYLTIQSSLDAAQDNNSNMVAGDP